MSEKNEAEVIKNAINERVDQPVEPKQNIKLSEKLGFMGFSTSSNIVFNFKNVFYLFFLTEVLGIEMKWAGIMAVIGTIWDAINDPLISLFCTNHKFKNGESIRPYALYMCVPWAISVVLLFVNFHLPQYGAIIVGIIVYLLFETFYTFLCMPYNSMASLSTKNDEERKSINAFRSLGTCLGSAIGALAIKPLVILFGGSKDGKWTVNDAMPILYTAIIMGGLCIAGSLWHYFTTKERIKPEAEEEKSEKIGLIQAYKILFKCKSWRLNLVYVCMYAVTLGFVMNNINYFTKYCLNTKNDATTLILAFYLVVAVVMSLLVPLLDKKIGRRKTMLLGIAVIFVCILPFTICGFIPNLYKNNSTLAVILMSLNAAGFGFGLTTCFIMFNTNRNNISDVIEVQNGRRMDTLISGGDNLINKLAEAAAIWIFTFILDATATYTPTGEVITYNNTLVNVFLGLVPMIFVLIMLIPAFKMNIPKELKESQMRRESVVNNK